MTPVIITGQYGPDFTGHVDGAPVRVAGNGCTTHLAGIVEAIDKTPRGDGQHKALVELTAFVPQEDITYLRQTGRSRRQ